MKPADISSRTQLLVEGKDGQNFLKALCQHDDRSGVQIQNYGGVNELGRFLRAFVRAPGFDTVQRLGIVRDAETYATGAFQSIQSALRNAALPVPPSPARLTGDTPVVGALVLPDQGSGMLETVVASSFAGTPTAACIDDFLACVEAEGATLDRPDKSRVFAYLAATATPLSVGVAAQRGIWDFDHDAFQPMRRFLGDLLAGGSDVSVSAQ